MKLRLRNRRSVSVPRIAVDDFDYICRICLKNGDDMVDIFVNGIDNDIMALTGLKMSLNDKLPRTLCQLCNTQLQKIKEFILQAKSSDENLKNILLSASNPPREDATVGNLLSYENDLTGSNNNKDNEKLKFFRTKVRNSDGKIVVVPEKPTLKSTKSTESRKLTNSESIITKSITNNENQELPNSENDVTNPAIATDNPGEILSDMLMGPEKCEKDEKLYLIVVPKPDDESRILEEIYVKDLTVNTENKYLLSTCKIKLGTTNFDHTYSKENEELEKINNDLTKTNQPNNDLVLTSKLNETDDDLIWNSNLTKPDENDKSVVYSKPNETEENDDCLGLVEFLEDFTDEEPPPVLVSTKNKNEAFLFTYECDKCSQSFEKETDATDHVMSVHQDQDPSFINLNFLCPHCNFYAGNTRLLKRHMKNHDCEKFQIIRVKTSAAIRKRLFKLNTESFLCTVCNSDIDAYRSIHKHLQVIHKYRSDKPTIKYDCPVCSKEWISNKKEFVKHIIDHKSESVSFMNVDSLGVPKKITCKENIYVPFEEAKKICQSIEDIDFSSELEKFLTEHKNIFKIVEINACESCEFEAPSFWLLKEHYEVEHNSSIYYENIQFLCPVCDKVLIFDSIDNSRTFFYDHLKSHKDDGCLFLKTRPNGLILNPKADEVNVFMSASELQQLISPKNYDIEDGVWQPKVILSDENYTCDICRRKFRTKKEIMKHVRTHINKGRVVVIGSYVCEICGRVLSGKTNFKRHCSSHFDKIVQKPRCSVCNKIFVNKANLIEHLKHHVKEGVPNVEVNLHSLTMICEICGKRFSKASSLARHKKNHLTNKENSLLKCEICNKYFTEEGSFQKHLDAHINPNYFQCEICKMPFPSLITLHKHLEVHQSSSATFDCTVCNVSFLSKEGLISHQVQLGHLPDKKPYECNVCHEKFAYEKHYVKHIRIHPKYKMTECNLCGKKLSTIQALMVHMDRHYGANRILCQHCGKHFHEKKNYNRHLLTHTGVKEFHCAVEGCGKSFYTLHELKRHQVYHNNTRLFSCDYCSKSFHESAHLRVHVRTHTGEKPYICPHCNKGFTTRTRCKRHIGSNHQGIGYELIKSTIQKKVTVFEPIETPIESITFN